MILIIQGLIESLALKNNNKTEINIVTNSNQYIHNIKVTMTALCT